MSVHELPLPYWFAHRAKPEPFDCVVVGAGIVGASTAYHVARRGLRVLVVEADGVASGATGRSTGLLLAGGLTPFGQLVRAIGEDGARRFLELSAESVDRMKKELFEGARLDCDQQPDGSWRTGAAGSPAEDEWSASEESFSEAGIEVEWRDQATVRTASGSDMLGGALFVRNDVGVDPAALCRGLIELGGAEVRTGHRVRRLEGDGSRVTVVWSGGSAVAERVVVAVNSQAEPLIPELVGAIRPLAIEGFAVERPASTLPGLWIMDGITVRQLTDGALLVTGRGARAPGEGPGYLELPTAGGQSRLEGRLHDLIPGLLTTSPRYRWAGAIALTADGLPRVGTRSDLPAVAYAAGFNGQGLAVGYEVGRRLAAWVGGDPAALQIF